MALDKSFTKFAAETKKELDELAKSAIKDIYKDMTGTKTEDTGSSNDED